MNTFREDLERVAQDGTEWKFGAVAVDLAAVPPELRLQYLPVGVPQFNNIMDTNGCASRGPLNILETKLDYFYDHGMHPNLQQWFDFNGYRKDGKFTLCDAFIEILSGTTPTGNSLKAPLDAIRKYGAIPADLIPLTDGWDWAHYMDKTRITKAHYDLGSEFLRRISLAYEQVAFSEFQAAAEDLLDVAGYAWGTPVNGVYPAETAPFNHCFVKIDNEINAFDNYDPFVKKLETTYLFFEWGYSLSITAQNPYPEETLDLFTVLQQSGLLAFFAEAVKRLLAAPVVSPVPPTATPAPQPPQPPHLSKISVWALAIQHAEGGKPNDRNTRDKNPGNLKYSTYTASLGGKKGTAGTDGGTFCYFDTYDQGFKALCTFLTDAANNKLRAYKNCTLDQFTTIYAVPPSKNYVNSVASALGVSATTPISTLL